MLNKVLLYSILRIEQLGSMPMRSWKRRQYNKIQDQTQLWLFGKEYFFSSHTQEKRTDEKELARRKNQDEVRVEYSEYIKEYLKIYRGIADCIKQFFPNYSAVKHDKFQLKKTIKRLFDYHLVHNDLDDIQYDSYPDHDYNRNINPESYWRGVIRNGVTADNFDDIIENELVREIDPLIAEYYSLRDSLTGWYIKKIIRCREWMTDTSQVFYSHFKFKDIPVDELCEKIKFDFYNHSNKNIFQVFGVTEDLINRATKATLNESGRKKKYTEWYNANKHKWRAMEFKFQHPKSYHLEILGLSEVATIKDIKKAYRKKVLTCHPDIVGGDGKEFIELTKSYDFLINRK